MKETTGEIVTIFWQDGEAVGMEYRNGELHRFMLKKATKADDAELLETKVSQ